MRNTLLVFFLLIVHFAAQAQEGVVGLWLVASVEVGGEQMTPNARWMKFNADHTQVSGNGRFQHSYGDWKFDRSSRQLAIDNHNGIADDNDPFSVTLRLDTMSWKREEEGQEVQVLLVRIDQLPETDRDKLLGLWQLKQADVAGAYFNDFTKAADGAYAFFRWDGRFVFQGQEVRTNGVYNVHGHRPEVELIPYGDDRSRDFWSFRVDSNTLVIKRLNSEEEVVRVFERTNRFP